MGAVPKAKAGVGSAVNDATRLFGGTLGVAVIGSIAASAALYSSRLASTAPAHLPVRAISAAKESLGGAIIAVTQLDQCWPSPRRKRAGEQRKRSVPAQPRRRLRRGRWSRRAGAIMAALFLPARPQQRELSAGSFIFRCDP